MENVEPVAVQEKRKKNQIFILLIGLVVLVLAVFALLLKFDFFKEKKETVGSTSQEQMTEKEKQAQVAIESTEKGLTKLIGGKVAEINTEENSLVVDIDPYGKSIKYTIYTDENTKFFAIVYPSLDIEDVKVVNGEPVFEQDISQLLKPQNKSVSFSDFEVGMQIEIRFIDYVDLDSDRLVAQSLHTIIQE